MYSAIFSTIMPLIESQNQLSTKKKRLVFFFVFYLPFIDHANMTVSLCKTPSWIEHAPYGSAGLSDFPTNEIGKAVFALEADPVFGWPYFGLPGGGSVGRICVAERWCCFFLIFRWLKYSTCISVSDMERRKLCDGRWQRDASVTTGTATSHPSRLLCHGHLLGPSLSSRSWFICELYRVQLPHSY